MRTLLIILLIVSAIANVAAAVPILNVPTAPVMLKAAPLLFAVGAIAAAVMLMRRSSKAFIPYLIGFALVLIANITDAGVGALPKAGLGFVILVLFFLPAVRNPRPDAKPGDGGNA
jgi:hypothetical protein